MNEAAFLPRIIHVRRSYVCPVLPYSFVGCNNYKRLWLDVRGIKPVRILVARRVLIMSFSENTSLRHSLDILTRQ